MNIIQSTIQRIDSFQQSHTALAFPIAVVKRYGDDKAGRQAALVTYYAFLSLFPLLLIFITVLSLLVSSNPALETRISSTVFHLFPDLGTQLQKNVGSLRGSGLALLLQIFALLYGARGLASILQETFNNLWHVDHEHRPGFVGDNLRSAGMMLSVGVGIVLGTALSYGLGSILHIGIIGTLLVNVVNIGVTFGLFLAVFRLGTSHRITLRKLIVGATIASIGTLAVQRLGTQIMAGHMSKLQGSYGSFALALGMLFWIYLQAQIILYAIVITVVRTEHDWPKKLF